MYGSSPYPPRPEGTSTQQFQWDCGRSLLFVAAHFPAPIFTIVDDVDGAAERWEHVDLFRRFRESRSRSAGR